MSERHMEMIQGSIDERQSELHKIVDILARAAGLEAKRASSAKVLLIFLGAFTATKGVADQIFGAASVANIVIYTLAGVLIATVAGLEAAYKFENKSVELKILSATCQSVIREVDSQWQKEIGTVPLNEQIEAARRLLELQDKRLADIQEKAARLGVNITLEVRKLYRDRTPYMA